MSRRKGHARAVVLGTLLMACGSETSSGGGSAAAPSGDGSSVLDASGGGTTPNGGGGSAGNATGGVGSGGGGASSGGSAGHGTGAGSGGGGASSGGSAGNAAGGTPDGGGSSAPCGMISTFEDGRTPSSEIHVAVGGSDVDGDGTAGNPYASIDRAASAASPGATIRVHAGTYGGDAYLDSLAGTADAPIWLGGAPGEARPVIEGGGQALHFVRARYLIVHDLEIRNQTANGINADDGGDLDDIDAARFVVFRNLSIHDIGAGGNQDCLKLSGLNDYHVLDSEFARCGGGASGSGVDHVGCHAGLIARNHFTDLTGSGNAIQCKGGSEDIEIRWNRIESGGERGVNMGGSTGFEFFRPSLSTSSPNAEARNIRVVGNVIVGGTAALAFVGCVECLAANNTIVDPENWVLRILQETTTGGGYTFLEAQSGRFVNNLITFVRGDISTYVNVGAGTLADTFTFENNLWYARDDASQSTPTDLPAPESGGVYGSDPALADLAGGDYAIAPSSPAAGAGIPVAGVTGDIAGACFGNPPSIGAFEAP